MKLINIICHNYTRLYVTGIKHLDFSPKKPMQVILASNGAGKSSLLKEIIPNADNLNIDYAKGGYRKSTYSHKDSIYVLSYTRDTNRHSFIKDGSELNRAGLKKIQIELISEHFGITKHVHELILSETEFTTMSVSERKKWFTEILSSTEYDLALKLFMKTKAKVKDLTSYIKLTQNKILQDESFFKVMSEDSIKKLKSDRNMFNNIIEEALTNKTIIPNVDKPDLVSFKQDNTKLSEHIAKFSKFNTNKTIINKTINRLTIELEVSKKSLDTINKDISELGEVVIDDSFNTIEIKNNINNIDNELNDFIKDTGISEIQIYLTELINFNNLHTELLELLDLYSSYHNVSNTNLEHITLKTELTRLSNIKDKLDLDIKEAERTLDKQLSFKEHDDVTCPRCENIFKPNFDNTLLVNIQDSLNRLYNKRDKVSNDLELTNKTYVATIEKNNLFMNIFKYLDKIPYLKTRIQSILDDEALLSKYIHIYTTLPKVDYIQELLDQKLELNNKLKVIHNVNDVKMKSNIIKKKELLSNRQQLVIGTNELTRKLDNQKKLLVYLNKINLLSKRIETNLRNITLYKRHHIAILNNEFYNSIIKYAKEEVYHIEEQLARYENVKEHYTNLNIDLKSYKLDLKANKKLEEYLSPNKGIIGLTISKTINLVLEKMNHIINKIWSQEITILPCDVEDSDLNYKFPVLINKVKMIPDVLKGSSSIREVIDLAFKITAMELLSMLDGILILDEFSKTMDPKNRTSSYKYIEELSKQHFSQVYLISHYEEMFSRFTHTEVNILNNDNINYQGVHNENLSLN